MRSKCIMVVLVFIATASVALSQAGNQKPRKVNGVTEDLREVVAKYRQALKQLDTTALDRIWADDYFFTNAKGELVTKAQRLANLKSGATAFDSIDVYDDETAMHVYGDVVVVGSRVALKARYGGEATSGDFRSLHVWVKRAGRWQMVANQLTRIAQP